MISVTFDSCHPAEGRHKRPNYSLSKTAKNKNKVEGMEDENGHQVAMVEPVGDAEVKIEERSRRPTTASKSQKVSTVSKTSPVNIVSFPP